MQNELINETSPYLLQHAHNPVHWQPWGEKALAFAKAADKPLLVSIGYSACHWCHVMERESFENDATAAIMNEYFINVKIDREERPDIDHIYMDAVQAISGSGGWPLNVFLTPEGKPFYGGTYFPPVAAFNRASWPDVLENIHDAWINRRDEMNRQAETLTDHLRSSNNFTQIKSAVVLKQGEASFTKDDCLAITKNLLANADTTEGGFGKAPKFPQTFSINCLLQSAYFFKDENALAQAELSLQKMLNGGIYDQLGGGLCRYSTDNEWLAPHFEKMLYDNALFITSLSNAYRFTKKEIYKKGITDTCDFIFREMTAPGGGFYAALDADSEGVEGKFYVWSKEEIGNLLGKDAGLFGDFYNVTGGGNWEHSNILRVLHPLNVAAAKHDLPIYEAEAIITKSKAILLAARGKRVRPGTDDKIILGWNALLVTAFCNAYAATGNEKYKIAARGLYDFINKAFLQNTGGFLHTYKNNEAKYPAFADDYAFVIEAAIQLQEITAEEKYLVQAKELAEFVIKNFSDDADLHFHYTRSGQTDVIVRKTEIYDGAVPSANAVMAKNLLYLSLVFDIKEWHERALMMIDSLKSIIIKHPGSFGNWASAAMNIAAGISEIAIIGTNMMPSLLEMLPEYLPNKILQASSAPSTMILLSDKPVSAKTTFWLCKNYACKAPVFTAAELMKNVGEGLF